MVNVLDADTGFSFGTTNRLVITNADLSTVTNASYGVLKSGTNVLVTILRTNCQHRHRLRQLCHRHQRQ